MEATTSRPGDYLGPAGRGVRRWRFAETLDVLERAGLRVAGAGRDDDAAARPAVVDVPGVTGTTGRVVVRWSASGR